jgi:hypothetical protein
MKKLLVTVSCFAAVLVLSKVSFAQMAGQPHTELNFASIIASAPPAFSPYHPSAGAYPAHGIHNSSPRAARRASRLNPPPTAMGHMAMGQVPPGMFGTMPPVAVGEPAPPVVVYRPTPIRNFFTLMSGPRPYAGYDPYVGYPPYPGYQPPSF